nr:FtsX-like permease family protein [endosymbiont 'TC1' of Trimyema compressum]
MGVLKAMGYSSNKIAKSYIIYGASVGFIGSSLGVLIGYLAYPSMMSIYAQFYNILFKNQSPNMVILFGLIIAITLILALVTYFFALSMSKKLLCDFFMMWKVWR